MGEVSDWELAASVLAQYGCDGWFVHGESLCLNRPVFELFEPAA